jgi:O-antigen/teichoic acid export membrane protein
MSGGGPRLEDLRAPVVQGIAWKTASQLVLLVTRVGVAILLARLLTPEEFGIAAMVLVFSALALVFSDLGAGIIQRPSLNETDRSTIFWTSVAVGVICTGAGVALAGPIAAFYGEPEVKPLFIAVSLTFVVTALATTQASLLTRAMDFRALELRTIVSALAGGAVAVAVAVLGYGAWAIIAQQMTIAVVTTVLLWWVSPWRPRFVYSRASLRGVGGFGANVFGTRLLFYANRNVDNLLIGRFLGASALGVYSVAYNVMLMPLTRLVGPLRSLVLPAFSRLQEDPARLASAWLRGLRLLAGVVVPAFAGLVAIAPDFVPVVLGEKWEAAVPVLQILAGVAILQTLGTLNGEVLQALDRSSTLLRFSIVSSAFVLVGFVVGLPFGIVGVAAGYAIASLVMQPPYTLLVTRALGVSLRAYVGALSGVVQASLVMLGFAVVLRLLLEREEVPPVQRLAIVIAGSAAVYLAVCLWRAPELAADLRRLFQRQVRPRAPIASAQAER